jgi:hypothetical protein
MVNPLKSGPHDHGFYVGGELLNLGVTIRMPTGFGISLSKSAISANALISENGIRTLLSRPAVDVS